LSRFRNETGGVLTVNDLMRKVGPYEEFDWPGHDPEVHGLPSGCAWLDPPEAEAETPAGEAEAGGEGESTESGGEDAESGAGGPAESPAADDPKSKPRSRSAAGREHQA
jgi:hypothetical protein